MSYNLENPILIVGAGPMAVEYSKVLDALNTPTTVLGRGVKSALAFKEKTGKDVLTGGVETLLKKHEPIPRLAIVAVSMEQLAATTLVLLQRGVSRILLEKPGGIDSKEIRLVAHAAKNAGAEVYVAYNRRFYASVEKALEIVDEDGGVTSFTFEFTEWSHEISGLQKAPGVKENWLLGNSTHVIDLAFFLGGRPREMRTYACGGLPWHPTASIFVGAGKTHNGALFSYHANWEAPGRWGVELLTKKHRFIFRPLEKLQIQKIASVVLESVELDDSLDRKFKPGLYREVVAFLEQDNRSLCSLEDQNQMLSFYEGIGGKKDLVIL